MRNELELFKGSFWNPLRELTDLQKGINHLFDDFGWSAKQRELAQRTMTPACDLEETENQYLVNLDLPGLKKEDIKVELYDRDLVISGERKEEKTEDKKSKHVVERYYGSFQRMIKLPATIKADQIQASYEDGVLRITVPKSEATKTKTIPVTDSKSKSATVKVA